MDKEIEIQEIIDNIDGSADLILNLTDEQIRFLVEYAINDILRRNLEGVNKENE